MTDATISSTTIIADVHHNPESPSIDSPATPVNNTSAPDVKIDIDFHEESDARHEPLPIKVEKIEKASAYTELPPSADSGESRQHSGLICIVTL
jgi:bromodomain-containing factor 1